MRGRHDLLACAGRLLVGAAVVLTLALTIAHGAATAATAATAAAAMVPLTVRGDHPVGLPAELLANQRIVVHRNASSGADVLV